MLLLNLHLSLKIIIIIPFYFFFKIKFNEHSAKDSKNRALFLLKPIRRDKTSREIFRDLIIWLLDQRKKNVKVKMCLICVVLCSKLNSSLQLARKKVKSKKAKLAKVNKRNQPEKKQLEVIINYL
jgi:hypothetical protein